MNVIFFLIVLSAFAVAAWKQLGWPSAEETPMHALSSAMVESATGAVELAIGLVGVMTLFLGLMKVAEAGGMLTILARLIRPLMVRLFPDIPAEHPAMGAMILNISANALGLGNAATPFGIRAMQELDTLNPHKGTASDSMVLFLAINTSSITLLPTGIIALRASAGSADPAGILPTTLFATACSTIVAIIAALLYRRFFPLGEPPVVAEEGEAATGTEREAVAQHGAYPLWVSFLALGGLVAMIPVTVLYGRVIAPWILPGLMLGFLAFGVWRRVAIYEVFVEGAKDGFQVALRIIPYLVAILVAVGMFRASGALEMLVGAIGRWTEPLGMPAEALPMALLRPLSGSGAYGVVASTINDPAIGPDSYTGYLVSTLQGSTETTFYVLAVYFGAVQIKRIRHALWTALTADVAAIIAAVVAVSFLFRLA
ncbi:MAG: spore maturation protein [Gammaproteobacteria bacterium]|nr:spore maturation protein [Gammaproteobacteria bacterium]